MFFAPYPPLTVEASEWPMSALRTIFYYGVRSIPRPYSLVGRELNDRFGFAVYDLVEEANAYFKQQLYSLLDRI
jgi:hypothetical protein